MTRAERLAKLRGLYGIVDDADDDGLPALAWAQALEAGGATVLQLRFKRLAMREALETVRRIRRALPGILLIVDDRPDLALLGEADGVHVGEEDLACGDVRRLLGEERLVGATARTVEDGRARLAEGADHLGVGPIFQTRSKTVHHPPLGTQALAAVCRAVAAPVVAIAGIHRDNIGEVAAAGARAAAVIAAVGRAKDPAAEARELTRRFARGAL